MVLLQGHEHVALRDLVLSVPVQQIEERLDLIRGDASLTATGHMEIYFAYMYVYDISIISMTII